MDVLYNNEQLRATIKFPSGDYVALSDKPSTELDKLLLSAEFSLRDGNAAVNPVGTMMSNSASLVIYDADDNLSPGNTSSPYYGEMVNGVKVLLEIKGSSGDWEPYGTWYTTGWSGAYYDGGADAVRISLEDRLNTLGQLPLPKVAAYKNIAVDALIVNVLTAAGIDEEEIYIDPALNQVVSYGISKGDKLRDFINSICQMVFARVCVDRNDIICFYPALSTLPTGNAWTLTPDELGSLYNKNEAAINYGSVKLSYYEPDSVAKDVLFEKVFDLQAGTNSITDITPSGKVISIEQVDVTAKDTTVQGLQVNAFQDYISLSITVSDASEEVSITGIGYMLGDKLSYVTTTIPNASATGAGVLPFDTYQVLTQAQATALAQQVATFVQSVSRSFGVSGTPLTPVIYPGDKIIIEDTGTHYDGEYKVTEATIRFSEGYGVDVSFIRI